MTDKPSLAPCPFSAVDKEFGHPLSIARESDGHGMFRVACRCGARGPVMDFTEAGAIEGWNTRAPSVQGDVMERLLAEFEAAAVEAQGAKWVGLSYIEKTLRSYGAAALSQQQPNEAEDRVMWGKIPDGVYRRVPDGQQPPSKLGEEEAVRICATDGFRRAVKLHQQGLGGINDIIREVHRALMNSKTGA